MRVLLFNLAMDVDDPVLGFATGWVCELAKRVERIRVITMRAGRVVVPSNVVVQSVGKERGYSEPRRLVEFYRHLFGTLRSEHVDVCFSHMIQVFTVLAAPVLRARGVPIVTWYAHPRLTMTLKLAHHLSDRMVTSLACSYPYRHDRVNVIGQGIDTARFSPVRAPDTPPVILCAGRISPVKDHVTLLKAVARLGGGHACRVVIVGDAGSEKDRSYVTSLRGLTRDLGLGDRVEFAPGVDQTRLPEWYARATVHVNLTPAGSADKVALEAMSCARPSLTANDGFKETLGIYADRLLFQHGNPEDLAGRLRWVLSMSEAERTVMGVYLRERISKLHDLPGLMDRLVGVLCELSSARGGEEGRSTCGRR